MRRALPAVVVSAAGITWLLHAQGLINQKGNVTAVAAGQPAAATTTTSTAPPSTVPGAAPTTTTPGAQRTVSGDTINTRWGPVQVSAVIQGTKLVDVQVDQYPNERQRSVDINDQALPLLHDEAMQAQSANMDGVSGATYTTQGYEQSLQSALDKASFGK